MKKNLILILLVATFLGCNNKKKDDTTSLNGTRSARADGTVSVLSFNDSADRPWGPIGLSNDQAGFTQNIQSFVSASMDPSDLGFVSSMGRVDEATGVRFRGKIAFPKTLCESLGNGSSQIVLSESNLEIAIYDDLVGTTDDEGGEILPMKIEFSKASAGEVQVVNNQIVFETHFKDQYGELVFQGELTNNNTEVSGFVWFQNFRSYLDEQTTSQMSLLGRFVTTADGFVTCR